MNWVSTTNLYSQNILVEWQAYRPKDTAKFL